jgi:hypothetical protein
MRLPGVRHKVRRLILAAAFGGGVGQLPSSATPPDRASGAQTEGQKAREAVFDSDPRHSWNRLHYLLYSRTAQGGGVYDQEGLEPPRVHSSRFLASGPSYREAVSRLGEFLRERSDERIKDPLKRAILQRDLWAVLSTTVPEAQQVRCGTYLTDRFEDPGEDGTSGEDRARRRELQKRLVQVMRRVALEPEEIDCLPDNLSQAAKGGGFPKAFNPEAPKQAFLPADLLSRGGTWVPVSNVTRADEEFLAAPEHVRFTRGRSVFTVFLRLPGGRKATEAFLMRMRDGDLPQFPEGTQTALLRRMLLIDKTGALRESPLTESLQVRVYRILDLGIPYEFTLRRKDLFAGRDGGLHALKTDETSYFDFQTRRGDVFEMPELPPAEAVLQTCTHCHSRLDGRGGIHTMRTIYARGEARERATGLRPTTVRHEAGSTIGWVRKSYTWGLLQGLWQVRAAAQ